jgi:Caspase domain
MTTGRWSNPLAAALLLATSLGALQLAPDRIGADRPYAAPDVPLAAAVTVAPPPPDVPIIPPDDSLGGELAPALPAPVPYETARPGQVGEVFALVVGIDDYPGRRSDLQAAVADADTVDAALAGFGVPVDNRVVLRNGQARRADLVAAVEALVATAGPSSTIVFAYAGHVRKLDGDTEAIVAADGGLLRDDELGALLVPSTAPRMWFLMASCYAGGFTELLAPGRILTAAADARSLAFESQTIHGSYLVHHLVREGWLEGRAGPTVQEAFAYADERIAAESPQRRPVQLDVSGALLRLGTDDPARTQPPPPPSASQPAPTPPPPSNPPTTSPPPPPPPTTEPPERTCTLVVLCHD